MPRMENRTTRGRRRLGRERSPGSGFHPSGSRSSSSSSVKVIKVSRDRIISNFGSGKMATCIRLYPACTLDLADACRVSSAVACRPPRPLYGAGAVIRTLCASFGGWLLSQEHPGCDSMQRSWCWRRDSNSHARRHWFLRPAWLPLHHSSMEHWRARGESNPRRGIDSAPSWPLEDAAKLGIPLRIRTGISSSVDSCPDPLDERDLGRTTGFEPAISRLKVWRLDRLPTSSQQTNYPPAKAGCSS